MAASRFSSDVLQLFCELIPQEENRRQERPIAPAKVAREKYIDSVLFGQKRFQRIASFVENGCPVQATRTKADFCNPREKQKKGLLI